jgi:hypothetical protein
MDVGDREQAQNRSVQQALASDVAVDPGACAQWSVRTQPVGYASTRAVIST